MKSKKPILAVTLGDPAGIGPEVVLKALAQRSVYDVCRPLVIGDAQILSLWNHRTRLKIHPILNPAGARSRFGTADVLHLPAPDFPALQPGRPSRTGGLASLRWVEKSAELALLGLADGVVHAPISKSAWRSAGTDAPGHTELLARICAVRRVGMAIAAGPLRTVLATRHLPLSRVARALTSRSVGEAIELAAEWMRRRGLRSPRIGVCAFNPHAGEGGLLGGEESRVIAPAVLRARQKLRCSVTGPTAADSAFRDHRAGQSDVLVTMYHDQSLIPLKLFAPEKLINVTLGLPFPRTSPGHGTAFDIAGKNRADARPMIEALLACAHSCAG